MSKLSGGRIENCTTTATTAAQQSTAEPVGICINVTDSDEEGAAARNSIRNFMHDPATALSPSSPQRVDDPAMPSFDLLSAPSVLERRKNSLMPVVTEEDLRSSNIGHKDPVAVAEVFGTLFASEVCHPQIQQQRYHRAHSPLPYDSKEKMVMQPLEPENTRLPFEIRDSDLPTGVPTVKMRRRPKAIALDGCNPSSSSMDTISNPPSYEDVSVALSPVQSKFPLPKGISLPANLFETTSQNHNHYSENSVEYQDIASKHPDLIHFQLVLNEWIRKHAKIVGCAFIMTSLEFNVSYCQVCANRTLEEPLICGSWDLMENVFNNQSLVKASKRQLSDEAFGYAPKENNSETPLVFSVEDLLQSISTGLSEVTNRILESAPTNQAVGGGTSDGTTSPSSLVDIRSKSGFQAALLVVHPSKKTVSDELACILPHIQMISTLMSIVENVEEQKRLAQQSEQMLSMAQSVFSSLRKSLNWRLTLQSLQAQ